MKAPSRWRPVRALVLLPLLLLGGCFEPQTASVDVHNHTDGAVVARDANWEDYDHCHCAELGQPVIIPARSARWVEIDVDLYDGDVEVDGDLGRQVYDVDFWPYQVREIIHVREADFAPGGNG